MVVHFFVCYVRLEFVFATAVGGGGGLVCESVGKADLLSDHFDGKQHRESVDRHSLTIRHRDFPPLPSGRMRSGVSCLTWTLMGHR